MGCFRLYFVGVSRKIVEAIEVDCPDDGQAIEQARQFLAERASARCVEIWDKARRVATIEAK